MKKYAIALKELAVKDEDIIIFITKFEKKELHNLFYHQSTDLLNSHLELLSYKDFFSCKEKNMSALKRAKEILNKNKELKIYTLLYTSKFYPQNLKYIDNPPAILYYKGAKPCKKHVKSLACIGTRTPSSFSENATKYLIPPWINENFVIISGLAHGVDTLCHKICLNNHGTTIAVLAHGLDIIYPKENSSLALNILASGGTLISEYPVGTPPEKYRFVERNRLISGLSLGVVVFEANEHSGTMRTVDYALKQNKPIFCPFPGSSVTESGLKGLQYIINFKNGIPIYNGINFEVPIFKLSFKLKNSTKRLIKIKEENISILLQKCADKKINMNETLKQMTDKEDIKRASILVNKTNYNKLKSVAAEHHISIKELINTIIQTIVSP